MIGILICKKKNFIIIFLSVVHPEWNWRITLLSALFEHCTCKWINIVQLLSCFDGSSYSRYLLAVRCIDASLLHPSLSSNYPLPNSRRALKMPIHAPRKISICVSLTLWIKDSIYNNTQIYRSKDHMNSFSPEINFYLILGTLIVISYDLTTLVNEHCKSTKQIKNRS